MNNYEITTNKDVFSTKSPTNLKEEITLLEQTIDSLINEINLFPKPPYQTMQVFKIKELAKNEKKLILLFQQSKEIKIESEQMIDSKEIEEHLEKATLCLKNHPIKEKFPWLKTGEAAPKVSKKILAHVLGDEFAQAANLEGESTTAPLIFAIACLEEKPEFLEEKIWKEALNLLKEALSLHEDLSNCYNLDDLTEKTELLKKRVESSLNNNSPLLMTGGWVGRPQGHGMYYMISPQKNGLVSFKLFNRGAGVNYHASPLELGYSSLYPAYKEIINIQKQDLLNPIFLQALIEINAFVDSPEGKKTFYSESDIYEKILPLLKGKENPLTLTFEDLMSPQISGTCAWKSLTAALQILFGSSHNKLLKYRFEMQAIWSFYEANREEMNQHAKIRNLLSHAVTSAAISLKSLFKEHYLTKEEYSDHLALLSQMEKEIEIADQKGLLALSKMAPQLPQTEEKGLVRSLALIRSSDLSVKAFDTHKIHVSSPLIYKIEAIKKWIPTSKNFLKDLVFWTQECRESNKQGNYATTQAIFYAMTQLLPTPTSQSPFWQEFIRNHVDCSEAVEKIYDLFQEFYKSCFAIPSIKPSLERVFCVLKNFHLQNLLMAHTPLSFLGQAAETHLEQIFSHEKRNLVFLTEDPQMSEELKLIYEDYISRPNKAFYNENHRGLRLNSSEVNESYDREKDLNPEFAYIKGLLKDSKFFNQAKQLYALSKINLMCTWDSPPENSFDKLNLGLQITFLFVYDNELLSPLFLKWRTHYFQMLPIVYGDFKIIPSEKAMEEKEFFPAYSIQQGGINETWKVSITAEIPALTTSKIKFDEKYTRRSDFCKNFEGLQRPFVSSIFKEIFEDWENNPKLSENRIYSEGYQKNLLSQPKLRELSNLATEKEIQITKITGFFVNHLQSLMDRDYQTLFHILLFDGNLLLKELLNNPKIVLQFQTILKNGYQQAVDMADIGTCVFYLNLSRRLKDFYFHVYPKKKEEKLFLNDHREINKLLQMIGLTHEEKSQLYLEKIASLKKETFLNEEQVKVLVKGMIHLAAYPLMTRDFFPAVEEEMKQTVIKHGFSIHVILSKYGDDILNEAVKPLISDFHLMAWKPDPFPIFKSNEEVVINVITGEIFDKKQPKMGMPRDILEDQIYKKILDKPYFAKKISFNVFELMNEHGDSYRIYKDERNCRIQRMIDGSWYEYKKGGVASAFDLIPEGFQEKTLCWISVDTPKKIVYYDSFKRSYPAKLELSENNKFEFSIFRHQDPSVENSLTLLSPFSKSPFKFLRRFENREHIHLWADKKNVRLIDLDRFHLNFKLDDSNPKNLRWMCVQKKGFYLAHHQFAAPMGSFDKYLVLQNDKGEKEILVPLNEMLSSNGSALSERIQLCQDAQRYATYTLRDKGGIGKSFLTPKNAEAALQLAYLKLASGHYREARHFLQLSKMPLKGHLNKELELLKKIIDLKEMNNDNNAEACALRMHAFFLYQELLYRHQPEPETSQKTITDEESLKREKKLLKSFTEDCETYVTQIKRVGAMRLPLGEEKILLQSVFEKNQGKVSYAIKWYMETLGIDTQKNLFSFFSKHQIPLQTLQTKIFNSVQEYLNYFSYSYSNQTWNPFFKAFHNPKLIPEKLQICYTRPNAKGLQKLLVCYMKKPSRDLQKTIEQCLQLSENDDDSTGFVFRAILEMLCKHPNKYKIKSPPNLDTFLDNEYEICLNWLKSSGISKILEDYCYENAKDSIESESYLSSSLPKISNNIPKEKTKVSRPPSAYIETMPESLSLTSRQTSLMTDTLDLKIDIPSPKELPYEQIEQEKKELLSYVEKTSEKFQNLLGKNLGKGRCVQNELKRLSNDCDLFCKKILEESSLKKIYTLDLNSLNDIKENLELSLQNSKQKLIYQEESLLKLILPLSTEGIETGVKKAPFLRRKREKIGIEQLVILYGRNQLQDLCRPPTSLEKDQLPEFKKMMENYLIQATKIQQWERALEKTETCLLQFHEKKTIDPEQIQFLIKELQTERKFEVGTRPECLVLEYWSHISLRKDQLEKLDKYIEEQNLQAVYQIIMGFGKTAILTRLISLLFADGKHLCMVIMPEALFSSVSEELREKQGKEYQQITYPFDFSRDSDFSIARLEQIKNRLLHIIQNKELLASTPKSIHCFYLKFIEIWRSMHKTKGAEYNELKKQFVLMRDILNIFKTQTKLLIDEVDQVLSCRTEVNFPVGDQISMTDRDMDLLFELHECFSEESIQQLVRCEFKKDHKFPNAPPFTQEKYHETVKPALAKHLLDMLKVKNFGNLETSKKINDFFINEKNPELLLAYLTRNQQLLEKADDYFEEIKDRDVMNILVLAKEELNTLLPLCLQKNCEESFGLDKNLFAIPFDNGTPTLGTQFSDPHETGSYTIEAYLYKGGIPSSLIEQQIKLLQEQAIDEMNTKKTKFPLLLKDTKAYQIFFEFSGKNENLHLFKVSGQDLEQIVKNINSTPELQKFFFKKYILPTIKFQTRKINSNAQTLVSLFYKTFGFSGTSTWNSQTYHDKLSAFAEQGTDARTLLTLLGKAGIEGPALEVSFETPQVFISQLPIEDRGLVLIDNGSYLRGENPRTLAKQHLERFIEKKSVVKGIIFFENGRKVVLEAGNSEPIPIAESRLEPHERFTMLQKSFTTGADIPQDQYAEAYVTIGKNILLRDLLQSVWRMRKLELGQKIKFVVSDEVKKIMNVKLGKEADDLMTTEKIILFSIINQANQMGEDNYISFKQKMIDAIQEEVRDMLFDPNQDIDDLCELYTDDMEEIFAPSTGKEPIDLYSGRERKEDAETVLKRDIERYMTLSEKILKNDKSLQRAKEKISSFQERVGLLHEELTARKQTTSNILVEIEIEEEKNIQQEVSQLREVAREPSNQDDWAFFPWPEGHKEIYSSSFYFSCFHNMLGHLVNEIPLMPGKISSSFFGNAVTKALSPYTSLLSKKVSTLATYSWKKFIPGIFQDRILESTEMLYAMTMYIAYRPPRPYPLEDFLSKKEKLQDIAKCLSSSLHVSFNFAPTIKFHKRQRIAVPFEEKQKLIQHVLIAYNMQTKVPMVMMIDQAETSQFRQKIRESVLKGDIENPEICLCLYDLQLNDTIESGKINPLDKKIPEIRLALAQAKLLAGEVLLTKEKQLIKNWFKEKNIDHNEFKNIYESIILTHHPEPQRALQGFNEIFEEK